MLWAVLILVIFVAIFGTAIYRIDKKAKSRHEKKFNPNEWQLPGHIELPASVEFQAKGAQSNVFQPERQPQLQSSVVSASVKINYETTLSVYSNAQGSFYKALHAALNDEFNLLTNISAVDVLVVLANGNALAAQVAQNNLAAERFAFVVCDKAQLKAVCVIDLGNMIGAQLKTACESAQLPVVSFNTQANYDSHLLRTKILAAVDVAHSLEVSNNTSASVSALEIVDSRPANYQKENGIDLVLCPTCSAVMLKRKAKNGDNAGKLFWICSTYPKCRGMRVIK